MSVAVIGAGGGCGLEVTKLLLSAGKAVRCIVRDPAKYEGKFNGAEVVSGDVSDEASLTAALAGCQSVVFAASTSDYFGAGAVDRDGVLLTAKCAAAAKLDRVVLISSRLVNPITSGWHPIRMMLNTISWGLMDAKYTGEQLLRGHGIDYVVVRPGGLVGGDPMPQIMRPFNDPSSDAASGKRGAIKRVPGTQHILACRAEGTLDKAVRSIHRADVAAVVVAALTATDAPGKTIEVVARPREDGDPSFADRVASIFADLPLDKAFPDSFQ